MRKTKTGLLAATLAAAGAMAIIPATAFAQTAVAQAGEQRPFSIEPQPVAQALTAFGRQSGYQVSFGPEGFGTLRSTAVSGTMTPEQALPQLLAGTGLTWRFTDSRTVVVERPVQSGGVVLPTVQVEALRETAWGPVSGYVATQSTTGTKTDTPLLETPQSISVVTRQQMDDQNVNTLAESLRYSPGVVVSPLGTQNKDTFYIRGFGDTDGGGQQYLDGLKIIYGNGFATPQIDTSTLERVELLRGPASVLYGQNSPGGMVNMTSKRPTSDSQNAVSLGIGSHENYESTADFSGPLDADGKFLYRMSGLARTNDTQFDFNRQERISLSPALTWRPSEDTSLTFLTNYQRDEPGGRFYNLVPAAGAVLPNPNGTISRTFTDGDPNYDKFDRKQYSLGYVLEHRFDSTWAVRQNVRYMNTDGEYRDIFSAGLQADQRTLNRFSRFNLERLDSLTVDNQAESKFTTGDLNHTALFGFDYRHTTDDNKVGLGFTGIPTLDLFNPVYGVVHISDPAFFQNNYQTQDQAGVYAQDQLRIGKWSLLLGGRHDWADSSTQNRIANSTATQSDTDFTWRTGLVYLFDNGLAPYVSYSTSFFPTAGTDFSGAAFQPTTGQQYEVGLKYQPSGFESFMTASVYNLTQQDVLTADTAPGHTGFRIQTGEIRARGAELEAHASLTSNIDLVGAYTYLDATVTESTTANLGKTPLYMPKHSASLWSKYTFNDGALAGLAVGGGVRLVGSSFGDTNNTFKVPDYAVFDAVLHYDLGRMNPQMQGVELAVNAENLFDETYVAGCGSTSACYYGNGRTFFANMTYKW